MSKPNDCPHLIEVHRLWEGEIVGRHAAEMRRHLAECSTCRAASAEWDRLSGLLARGDPAAEIAPENRQRMKAELLAACAASLAEPSSAEERGLSRPPPRLWRMPLRIALAMVPLALAALWLVQAVRHASPNKTMVVSRPDVPLPLSRVKSGSGSGKTKGRGIGGTRRHLAGPSRAGGVRPLQTGAFNLGAGRSRARHSRYTRHPLLSLRLAAVYRQRPAATSVQRPRRVLRLAGVPLHLTPDRSRHRPVTQVAVPAADPPIERLVIQADAPRPVPVRTVTHLTVIAAGDLKAPGAQLTIVKSEKEEALP